jgi:septal ring factor EnvC (AmiA/AmiB activator)
MSSTPSALETLTEKISYLDQQIAWAQDSLQSLLRRVRTERDTIDALIGRREEHQALLAEIEQMRAARTHAEFVAREPVVIIPRAAA